MWREFFSESSNASMTRLVTFLLVNLAIVIQLIVLWIALNTHGQLINNVWVPADTNVIEALNYATFGILGLGLGAKITQKFGEKNTLDSIPKEQKNV